MARESNKPISAIYVHIVWPTILKEGQKINFKQIR